MNVDLSGSIYEAYRKARARADELRQSGEAATAASVYREAARLARQYARYAVGAAERARRIQQARDLDILAEQLATGKAPPPPHPEGAGQAAVAPAESNDADELRGQIESLITRADVAWEDIGGLQGAKREIQLAFGLAMAKKPTAVKIDVVPNILLYGPPGTGKSLLASAVSNGLDATFFNVSTSRLLSKWFGESPRLVTTLYETARDRSPSVVFMDELESLFPSRDSATTGAERRVLSSLLAEISGVATSGQSAPVFTIGATNAPWLMDEAALSRFGRRIHVPLPDAEARHAVLGIHLTRKGLELDFAIERLVEATEGLSARQLAHVAARAVEAMVAEVNPDLPEVAGSGKTAIGRYEIRTRPLAWGDFDPILAATRPDTSAESVRRFEDW